MQRVLITGVTGFVGSRLAEILVERGVPVTGLVRTWANADRLTGLPVTLMEGDILDLDSVRAAVQDCDVVVHCAVDNRAYDAADADKHCQASTRGTANVLQAALEAGVERVVHLSSVAVHSFPAHAGAATEEGEYRYSGDAYCDGKIEAERVALEYYERHGLPVAILRPTLVYGPFNYWSAWLASAIRAGQMVLVDGGSGICNALYVDNLVEGILLAAVHPQAPGQVFHLADAAPVSWREFIEGHARVLGEEWLPLPEVSSTEVRLVLVDGQVRARVDPPPPSGHSSGAAPSMLGGLIRHARAALRRMLPTSLRRRTDQPSVTDESVSATQPAVVEIPAIFLWKVVFSIAKAQAVLGYRPAIDFATGMERTAAWMREAEV